MPQKLAGRDEETASRARPTRPAARAYRPELQGLRALAVLLVVVYHVWLDRVSGGVDVFFVISGFLLTGQLVRATGRGRVEFLPLWGRMIKRLFPAALTVLLAIMAASVLLLPESRWFQAIREVVAAALYVENWQLTADSVDYFAQNNGSSVVQHFWSLSIQGQLFLAWPPLIVLVALVARRVGGRSEVGRGGGWGVGGTLAVLFVASLWYSVTLTAENQPLAYFHSLTRVWEFVLGGLLALCVDSVVLPRLLRVVLGWVGVVGLVSCGLVLQVGTVFPGYAALWPTVSAVLVLLAGATGSDVGADRFLSSRPLRYIGDISYSLYLWHWPVLLFYLAYRGQPTVGIRGGAVIIATSLVLAALTYRFVEEPARKSRWGSYRFGVALLVPVLLVAGAWQVVSAQRAKFAVAIDDPDHPGAAAMYPGFRYRGADNVELMPPMIALPNDWGSLEGMDCEVEGGNEAICTDRASGRPSRQVVMIGDSHMQQYLAALRPIAEKENWELTAVMKGACPFSTDAYVPDFPQECLDWNARALDKILSMRPDAVFTQATRDARVGLTEETPPGFVAQWQTLADAGVPVVAVRDSPRLPYDPPGCVQVNGPQSPACQTPRAELYASPPPYQAVAGVPANVSFLDFTDFLCTATVCPPIIGNVFVYRDFNHPTATFMRTLSPIVAEQMAAALGW